jgi:ornithine carbamoyltransferase
MGEESEKEHRLQLLRPYQVNMDLVKAAGVDQDQFMFLHCLPAFHDHETAMTKESGALEVTNDVFEAPFSRVFDEAENRMHTIKALYVSSLVDGAAL